MMAPTSDTSFDRDVLHSELPVFVDFWRDGQLSSKLMAPIIEGLGRKLQGKAKVYKLNVEHNPVTAQRCKIGAVPKVILFLKGRPIREFSGIRPTGVYLNALSRLN